MASASFLTNSVGHIIFADSDFLHLIGKEAQSVIGEPIHHAFGAEYQAFTSMIQELIEEGEIQDQESNVLLRDDTVTPILLHAIANYDINGIYLGGDFEVQVQGQASPEDESLAEITESVDDAPLIEEKIQTSTIPSKIDSSMMVNIHIQSYFKQFVENAYRYLRQVGGKKLAENIPLLVNRTAQHHEWQIEMDQGNVTIYAGNLDSYQALIARVIAFVIKAMGESQARRIVSATDKNFDEAALKIIPILNIERLLTS